MRGRSPPSTPRESTIPVTHESVSGGTGDGRTNLELDVFGGSAEGAFGDGRGFDLVA